MIDVGTEQLLTVTEAAHRLGKCRETVRGWIDSGLLEGIKLGGRWHTSVEALRRFARPVEQRESPTTRTERRSEDQEALKVLERAGVTRRRR